MKKNSDRIAAIAEGRKTYRSDKPCARGHLSERSVSNYSCIACRAEDTAAETVQRRAALDARRLEERRNRYIPNKIDMAYAAGLFDGEGSITIRYQSANPNGTRSSRYAKYALSVEIGQTDLAAVKWMHDVFGGALSRSSHKISYRDGRLWMWHWSLAASSAADFLRTIKPLLKIKTAEAEIALAFQASMTLSRRQKTPENVIQFRRECFTRIRALRLERKVENARG